MSFSALGSLYVFAGGLFGRFYLAS